MLAMWDAFVCEKKYEQHRKDSRSFFQSSLTNRFSFGSMQTFSLLLLWFFFLSNISSSSISFPFFYSPSQIRRFTLLFLIPFPFHYHRFCSKLRDDDGNDEGKIKKTQNCGQRFETNKLKRWKLVWMQWAESSH